MKQRVKHNQNNRRKGELGLAAAAIIGAIISAATTVGTTIYSNEEQKKRLAEQNRKQTMANNEANAQAFAANQSEAMNYNQNEEIATARTGTLSTLNGEQSNFKYGGNKKLRRKYKNYTDPYAKDWYLSIFRNNNFKPVGVSAFEQKQAALNAADYVESMYRYHQKKYLHNRDSVENTPTFVGPSSPKGYISDTIKKSLQFENYDSRNFGSYNNNYPDLPADYNKYKCGGTRRMKRNGGNVTSNISKLGLYI